MPTTFTIKLPDGLDEKDLSDLPKVLTFYTPDQLSRDTITAKDALFKKLVVWFVDKPIVSNGKSDEKYSLAQKKELQLHPLRDQIKRSAGYKDQYVFFSIEPKDLIEKRDWESFRKESNKGMLYALAITVKDGSLMIELQDSVEYMNKIKGQQELNMVWKRTNYEVGYKTTQQYLQEFFTHLLHSIKNTKQNGHANVKTGTNHHRTHTQPSLGKGNALSSFFKSPRHGSLIATPGSTSSTSSKSSESSILHADPVRSSTASIVTPVSDSTASSKKNDVDSAYLNQLDHIDDELGELPPPPAPPVRVEALLDAEYKKYYEYLNSAIDEVCKPENTSSKSAVEKVNKVRGSIVSEMDAKTTNKEKFETLLLKCNEKAKPDAGLASKAKDLFTGRTGKRAAWQEVPERFNQKVNAEKNTLNVDYFKMELQRINDLKSAQNNMGARPLVIL